MSDNKRPPVTNLLDWKARTKSAESANNSEQATPPSIGSAMRSSALYVLIGLGVLAVMFALPAVEDAVRWAWHAWARLITHGYSAVTPALWIDWLSMIAAAWSLAMALKLRNSNFDLAAKFAGLMVALLLFGAIPALSALFATAPGMKLPDGSFPVMAKAAFFSASASMLLIGTGVMAVFLAIIVNLPPSKSGRW